MRNAFRRSTARTMAAVSAMTVSLTLVAAAPAFASGATTCPRDGFITKGDRCTSLSNGVLSVGTVAAGNYVGVNYYRTGGSALSAKLGYERSGSSVYSSYISMNTAPFHYYRGWSYSASCAVVYGKLLTSGGTLYVTPAAASC